MNVGSILNGDSPPDNDDVTQNSAAESGKGPLPGTLHHRHSINDLLNDSPAGNGKAAQSQANKVKNEASMPIEASVTDDSALQSSEMSNALSVDSISEEDEPRTKDEPKAKKESEPIQTAPPAKTQQKPANTAKGNHLVESELDRINKLKQQPKKPHRYPTPPIWAQEWFPPSQNGREPQHHYSAGPVAAASTGGLSLKPVFDRSSTVSADLECLITGVIPPQSVVRTIAEWIYANFVEIPLENRQFVELELKFGTIKDRNSGHRLDIGVSSECIYTKSLDIQFDMGVHEVGWNDMRSFLEELEKTYQDENRKNPAKPRRKFSVLEIDNTDLFFQIAERNEMPKKIRITRDNALNPPRYSGILKKRLADLYIHNPSSMYDLRLSLSMELPISESSIEPILKKNKPTLTRIKRRTSWTHAPTATQFDFTRVLQPRTSRNKQGKTVTEHDHSHELEMEIDTQEIFKGFDKIRDGSDTIRFEELVEVFLNNARCLNNRVTKLASK